LPALSDNQKYYWRVRACNQAAKPECSAWAKSYFREAMLTPGLLAPIPNDTLTDTTPDFDWQDVAGASSYTIMVSTYSNFSSPLINLKVTGSSYTSTKILSKGKLLYWKVRANGANGPSPWSEIRSFTIQ
jgi:hypothetical protein